MEVVTGAMGSLLPKLGELLMDEYKLQKGVKKDVESLTKEMKSMHAALRMVGEVPRDQLDEQVKLWADEVRELSYNMEDVVDKFLVRVDDGREAATDNSHKFKPLMGKMGNLLKKSKTRHEIADAIKDINREVQEVAARRDRNKVDALVATSRPTAIDPRLRALYTEATELVGIYGKRDQDLMRLLSLGDDDVSNKKLKIVSVVGFGGLGKTTLVKAVYDKIKRDFDCRAFVPVGRNPDVKKIFRDILIDLDKQRYTNINLTVLDERQLIEEIREFLQDKRYLVVIDDLWGDKLWKDIKSAFFNRNNVCSRLITTTRIVSVSKACCLSVDDSIYKMEPLNDDDSRRLFYKRIFSRHSEFPCEFEQVSGDILKKCGGVPLAIITIASLLASDEQMKSLDEWYFLLQSIGRGLTENASLDEMQRILSFSYYDLPSYLKTCLLYLSIYPEDRVIGKDQLIWKWVAERFVHCEKLISSLFELGETYFNELINRSMIQPIYNDTGEVDACRVHDMVLDLICSLASEENFVTILNGSGDITSSQNNVRRLSLQNKKEDLQAAPLANSMSISQVRSITIFPPAIKLMPPLPSFDVLHVLDLSGCNLTESGCQLDLRDVGNLFHLRYLSLANTGICELPSEIGNLQFLQVLDVGLNYELKELPCTVCKLSKLTILKVECKILPDVLVNLTSIEVLKTINASLNIVQELGNLARLRELEIGFSDASLELEEAFVESLCRLHNIKSLVFWQSSTSESMDPHILRGALMGERWVPPRHLYRFDAWFLYEFSALPAWIMRDPSHPSNLSDLRIRVKEVQQEDVRILGRLPALRRLFIHSTHQTERRLVIVADGFRSMITFGFHCGSGAQIVFERGALSRAKTVGFDLGVRVAKDDGNGDFDSGLQGNLLALRDISVWIYGHGATIGEAEEAEAAVRHALHDHPNHPTIDIVRDLKIPQDTNPYSATWLRAIFFLRTHVAVSLRDLLRHTR